MTESRIVFTARRKAELVTADPPPPLGAAQVRGRTLATAISPGTELNGQYHGDSFPASPGYAAVFEVEQTGSAVEGVRSGDRLFCMGGHASFQQLDVKDCVPVPEGLDPVRAPIARLLGVPMTTLMTTAARPQDIVVVTGLGPIGYCASCVFSISGYHVHGVEPDDARRAMISHPGIKALHRTMPLEDPEIAGKAALVVECSGNEQAVVDACKVVRKGGEVVIVGVPWRRRTELTAHDLTTLIFHRYAVVRSGWEWQVPMHESDFRPYSIVGNFRKALAWLQEGRIPLEGLITRLDPRNAAAIYSDLAAGKIGGIFPVLDWSSL